MHRRSSLMAVLLGVGLLAGCNGAPASAQGRPGPGARKEEPLPVEVTHLGPGTIERYYRTSGALQALQWAEIRPVQAGIIVGLEVEEGDNVAVGQALARLDARELALMASRDKLAATNAERELERLEAIAGRGAVAREELDKQRYQLETAKASAKLSRQQAARTTLVAPFAGTVVSRKVDVGNLATSTTVLFELADLRALELDLHLPEREALLVKLDTPVELELVDETRFMAKVVRRAPVVDAATGTVRMTIRAEDYPAAAVPGSFARARVLLESRSGTMSLPRSAVFELEGTPHVYAVIEGKAQRVPVTLGLSGEDRVEVTDGLTAEQIVVVEASGMAEGLALTPVETAAAGAAAGT